MRTKPTTTATATNDFQPIKLLAPDASERERIQRTTSRYDQTTEVGFILSAKPHSLWVVTFQRLWASGYAVDAPDVRGNYLVIECLPADLASRVEMTKVVIEETNYKSEALIRARVDRGATDRKYSDLRSQLAAEHAKPITVPFTAQGDVLLDMLYKKQIKDRADLEKQVALAAINDAIGKV